jgi:hypothetical protein
VASHDRRRVDARTWRDTVASPDGPRNPQARHVLLTLSLHMAPDGGGAWPSQALLVARTGLADRTVRRCLAAADTDGWIAREYVRRDGGQNWRRTVYAATLPAHLETSAQGPVTVAAPSTEKVRSETPKVRSETTEGPVRDDTKVRSQRPINSPIELSKNIPLGARAGASSPEWLAPALPTQTPEAELERLRDQVRAHVTNPARRQTYRTPDALAATVPRAWRFTDFERFIEAVWREGTAA